jgi:hypothetical protein
MLKRLLFFLAALVIGGAAWQLVDPKPAHAGTCCQFGNQCSTNQKCCNPMPNEANCSAEEKNYCITGTVCPK